MYDSGDLVPLTVEIKDANGNLTNAGSITLTIGLPDGTSVSPTPTNPTTGRYQVDYLALQPGKHSVSWVATSPNAAFTDIFEVRVLSPRYIVSLADTKTQLNITTTSHDEQLRVYIGAATGAIERHLNKTIVKGVFTEEKYLPDIYRGFGQVNAAQPHDTNMLRKTVPLSRNPAISLTSVARVDGTMTWDVSLLHLDPDGIIEVIFGPALMGHISITYVAGMTVVPEEYVLAAEIIIQHLWETNRGNAGSPRPGGFGDPVQQPGRGYAIPNRARELLGDGLPGFA